MNVNRIVLSAIIVLLTVSAYAADYTISVADDSGVTYARTQYNAALPKDKDGNVVGALATDQEYIQFVVTQAAQSYARQAKVAPLDDAKAKCLASGDCADAAKVQAADVVAK